MLINASRDLGQALGILSSSIHTTWALACGSRLEDRPVYVKTTCFEPFPFPALSESPLKQRIRELGERLDSHRKRQQEQHPGLTLTGIYNVLEKLRSGEPLTAKEKQIHDQGLVTVLRQIHDVPFSRASAVGARKNLVNFSFQVSFHLRTTWLASAVRYSDQNKDCCILIVSEDGTAEWIPNLRPQIKKSDMDTNLSAAGKFLSDGFTELRDPAKVLTWMRDHKFYLSQEACETANQLQQVFDKKSIELQQMQLFQPPLKPNLEMNDSYFI